MNDIKATLVIIGIAAVLTIATTTIRVQSALALVGPSCAECGASSLAPGTKAKSSGDAQQFAPGQQAKHIDPIQCHNAARICQAKDFAPGQEGLRAGIIGPELKK